MKRILRFVFVLATIAIFIPNVYAASDYGKVTALTSADSVKDPASNVLPDSGEAEEVTVAFTKATLNKVGATGNERPAGYAWLGFHMVNPSDADDSATFSRTANVSLPSNIATHTNTQVATTGDDYYVPVDESLLKAATKKGVLLTYTYVFNWSNGKKQTVKVTIDPANITLYEAADNSKLLWNKEIYEQTKAQAATKTESKEEAKTEDEKEVVGQSVIVNGNVNVTGHILDKNAQVYTEMNEMMKKKGYTNIFEAYELTMKSTANGDDITLTFKVGVENNDKRAYILHKKHDNTYEEFTGIVKNGEVKITVKELSPFMIALADVEKTKDDMPTTGEVFPIGLLGMMIIGAMAGISTLKKVTE